MTELFLDDILRFDAWSHWSPNRYSFIQAALLERKKLISFCADEMAHYVSKMNSILFKKLPETRFKRSKKELITLVERGAGFQIYTGTLGF